MPRPSAIIAASISTASFWKLIRAMIRAA
jgi:hypothetical protein